MTPSDANKPATPDDAMPDDAIPIETTDVHVRMAVDGDRAGIAATIAEAFSDHFKALKMPAEAIAGLLQPAIDPGHFIVAVSGPDVVGTLGVADENGYPLVVQRAFLRRELGWLKGSITAAIMADEYYRPKSFTPGQGHIDFVAVRHAARGRGVAAEMLRFALASLPHHPLTLDVVEGNERVLSLYQRAGFKIVDRPREKHGWMKGFRFRYLMRQR